MKSETKQVDRMQVYKEKALEKFDAYVTTAIGPKTIDATTKWIVLSFDALSASDMQQIKHFPNFNKLMSSSTYSYEVKGVYPTLTYPSHASFVTGKVPKKHGIVSNTLLQPTRQNPDWRWAHKGIHGPTLFSEAKKAGMRAAALLWPVTAGAPIVYNMPEIFANRPWQNQMSMSLLSGSKRFQLQMNKRHGQTRQGLRQPQLDDFVHKTALDTLNTYKPEMLFVHYTDLDTQKHINGTEGPAVKAALKRLDNRLGDYFKALKQLPGGDQTKILVFGDHSSKPVHTAIRPNVILQKEGFLSVEDNGKLHHCDFIFKSCDGSAYLYHDNLHRVSREVLRQELDVIEEAIAKHSAENGGILKVMRGHDAGYEGADPHALLMLEAADGFYFLDDYSGELFEGVPENLEGDSHWLKASHGYHPDTPDYKSVCFFWGKNIPKQQLSEISLMDLGVTIATDLGFDLGETDGKTLL